MKRMFIAALFAAFAICSCSKDESKKIIGSYTYKTSGTVTLNVRRMTEPANPARKQLDTFITVSLVPEQGQMHIVSSGGDGAVKITFNDIAGNVHVADARVSGSSLTFEGSPSKDIRFSLGRLLNIDGGSVTYSGSGVKYDRTLIADLNYEGDFGSGNYAVTIVGSDVHCVAQSND